MAGTPDPYAAFRLNLEQQRKRAKDLLRAARASDRAARERFRTATAGHESGDAARLTDAQFVIARELGFATWRELRAHITAMAAHRAAIGHGPAPDAGPRTLHVRCGSDIQQELVRAGFTGDFLSLWDPLSEGPVTTGADWIEARARFLAEGSIDLPFEALFAELRDADLQLAASPDRYERVVLWMEHDSHDQLSLIRCLARYASGTRPRVLELISVDRFPGTSRFIGLGQLPPEAMRLLWRRRTPVGPDTLGIAADAWTAVTGDDPRALVALVRRGTPGLPHLARALHRHLRELPSAVNGLSLTEALTLQMLDDGDATIGRLFGMLHAEREPLPFLGDGLFLHIVTEMERAAAPVFQRTAIQPGQPFRDRLTITDTGRAVLRGATDWMSLQPPPRWVGGVRIQAGGPVWRWDDARQDVVRR
jgi:hypothetical protein